jgi:LysR family glycine cleavage system transcriptional activator
LSVSPSSVSHLLRDLERSLGVALFAGPGPRGRLSETGETLARRLGSAFDAIDLAVAEASRQSGDVRVSALSSFVTLWLVPRLGRFQALHPTVRLLLATGMRPVDLSVEPFACAIRWGAGGWTGLQSTLLFRDRPVVVANPRALEAAGGVAGLARLAVRTRPEDWALVAPALGLPLAPPALTFETRALAVQAAMAGIGAAVVDRNLVADILAAGLLAEVAPDPPLDRPQGHFFVALPERLRDRAVRQFRDWLVTEAEARGLGRSGGAAARM